MPAPRTHTFLLATLRSSSALFRSNPWPASSRSSSRRLSLSSCWNSRSSNSFVSVSRASASCKGSDKGSHHLAGLQGQAAEGGFWGRSWTLGN